MNTKFSDRIGITKPRDSIQIESMDDALKNGLWNILCKYYWDVVGYKSASSINLDDPRNASLRNLSEKIIEKYFKEHILELFKMHGWTNTEN